MVMDDDPRTLRAIAHPTRNRAAYATDRETSSAHDLIQPRPDLPDGARCPHA